MSSRALKTCLLVGYTIVALALSVGAGAETHLNGKIGADLADNRFGNDVASRIDEFRVQRSLSNQYLELGLTGPMFNENFANYVSRLRLSGIYYSVESTTGDASEYREPQINNFHFRLGMFPSRPYPLTLHYSKSRLYALRYEANNRARLDQVSPELAAVRRYDTDFTTLGAEWQYTFNESSDVVGELRRDESKTLRRYDFEEHRDIYVSFTTIRPDPTVPFHLITLLNSVPEGTVDLVIDGQTIHTLQPNERFEFQLSHDSHDIEMIPSNYKSFRSSIEVDGDMLWRALFNPPPGQSDIDQGMDVAGLRMTYGRDQRFENQLLIESTDTSEDIQGVDTGLLNVQNIATYDWTREATIHSLSSWTDNDVVLRPNEIRARSTQGATNLLQQTTLRYAKRGGRQGNLTHAFTRTGSVTDIDDITTVQNRLDGSVTQPMGPLGHEVRGRVSLTMLGDSQDYESNQRQFELIDTAFFRKVGVNWRPRTEIRYTTTDQKNPTSTVAEWETRESIDLERGALWKLGKFQALLEHGWRSRDDGFLVDSKNKYKAEFGLSKNLGQNYKVGVATVQENEIYDVSGAGEGPIALKVRDPERRESYRFDLLATPVTGVVFGANHSRIRQNDSKIIRTTISSTIRIPKLDIPIRTTILSESRVLAGQDEQTLFDLETKASMSVRQVRVIFAHSITRESLISEDYYFQEVRFEVSRDFSIF